MIRITYDFGKLDIKAKGHSMAKVDKGDDLVCACVTHSMMTLARNVAELKEQGFLKDATVNIKDGSAHIKAVPNEGAEPIVKAVYTTIFMGLELLAHDFPEYVSFESRGVEKAS